MYHKVLISAFAVTTLLCSCTDDKSKNDQKNSNTAIEPVKPVVTEIAETDSTPALWSIDGTKWIKDEKADVYTWTQATNTACPDDYRIPTMEEFKILSAVIPELSKNIPENSEALWWTSSVSIIGDADSIHPSIKVAKLTKGQTVFQFVEKPYDSSLKVRCIQDTTNNPVFENPAKYTVDSIQGYITETKFTPYYEDSFENMGCADCCCEEGNGGSITVTVNPENGKSKSFKVLELSDDFCGTISQEDKGAAAIVDRKEGCIFPAIENFQFLQLFKPGVKVRQSSCMSSIFIHSEMGDSYEPASCGDSIILNLSATLQNIALVQTDNPEDEKVCSYSLLMAGDSSEIHANAPCSNAEIGKSYNIQVTIILEAITAKNQNPIREMFYPCCYGEVRSFQLTDIQFK